MMTSSQKQNYDWPAALGTTVILTIFLLIAFSAVAGWDWLSRFLESSAPNWVQAIGSLLGIFIAIWIPTKFHKEEKKANLTREWHNIAVQLTSVNAMTGALVGATNTLSKQLSNPSSEISVEWLQKHCKHLQIFPLPSDEQISKLGMINPKMGSELAQGKVAYITVLNMLNNITKEESIDKPYFIDLLITIYPFLADANSSFKKALESSAKFSEIIPREVA